LLTRPKPFVRIGQVLLAASLLLMAWMQRLEPGLNPSYAPISFYARLNHGWMLLVALLMMSAASLAFSRAYKLVHPSGHGSRPLLWLSALIALAALLRAHTYFPWEGPPTVEGTLHMIDSVCAFAIFAYAAFVVSAERGRRILRVLAALFFAASAFTCAEAGVTLLLRQKPQYMGLEERCILFIALVWFYALFWASDERTNR